MSEIENQQEKIANLLKLISENPDLGIVPMVDSDCIQDEGCSNWLAKWGEARVGHYYSHDERIYFKEYDFEELVDKYIDDNCSEECDEELCIELAEKEVEKYNWVKAIVVSIDPN